MGMIKETSKSFTEISGILDNLEPQEASHILFQVIKDHIDRMRDYEEYLRKEAAEVEYKIKITTKIIEELNNIGNGIEPVKGDNRAESLSTYRDYRD